MNFFLFPIYLICLKYYKNNKSSFFIFIIYKKEIYLFLSNFFDSTNLIELCNYIIQLNNYRLQN